MGNRSVRIGEISEWRTLKACWKNNDPVPHDFDIMLGKVEHRLGHKIAKKDQPIVDWLWDRAYSDLRAEFDALTKAYNEVMEERNELVDTEERLEKKVAELERKPRKIAPAKSRAKATPSALATPESSRKASPPITKPQDVARKATPVPLAAVGVVATFDALLEAGIEAIASGDKAKMKEWVGNVAARDRPSYG